MNKTSIYVISAVLLGLTTVLLPTWLFLVRGNREVELAEAFERVKAQDWRPPLLSLSEQNDVKTVSPKEMEIFGFSFIIALIVYILFKRKTGRQDYILSPFRPY
ncbi:MAG: hypothetical protein ACLFU9_02620 [Candidatus Bathyarchaeia archaeon]